MGAKMNAKVRGIWLLVECPFCYSPQVMRKHVMDNTVASILKKRYEVCDECGEGYFVELTEMEVELD